MCLAIFSTIFVESLPRKWDKKKKKKNEVSDSLQINEPE